MAPYTYGLLKPSRLPDAATHNAALLGPMTLGIEVTEPELAAGCGLGNVDPQHGEEAEPGKAAIEVCLDRVLPPHGSILVTLRPDLDGLGAMAVLTMRAKAAPLTNRVLSRVAAVACQDRFARGAWPGRRPLPETMEQADALLGEDVWVAPMAAVAFDHAREIEERVRLIECWFADGHVPGEAQAARNQRAEELLAALRTDSLRIRTTAGGRLAVVEGTAARAVQLGYCLAPVVVALNPKFRFQGGQPHRKFTVCQYRPGYADLVSVAGELANLEPGWGGSPTIVGSPQGISSRLELSKVVRAVERRLDRQRP